MRHARSSFALRRDPILVLLFIVSGATLVSCRTLYYDTMEAFGRHKRDLLVSRVADARDDQEAAKEQFQDALEKFTSLVGAEDSSLRSLYDDLRGELERCETKARRVQEQIAEIETVSDDLFAEWEKELDQYSSDRLRRSSAETLDQTRRRYAQMLSAMKRPERKMEDVLVTFRDHVLFLKHNLNAQAVTSLQGTIDALEIDTAELVAEMEAAIAEADSFIRSMERSAPA